MYYSNRLFSAALNERLGGAMSAIGARYPASWADGSEALVFSIGELDQQTVRIMSEIEKAGKPAIITRDGRFVATITPLAPGQAESRVLAEIARQIAERSQGHRATAVTARQRRSPALATRATLLAAR
jgi:antitoxin (DNA-binding transcriptional repressor) of toxin-antitoxin stability system